MIIAKNYLPALIDKAIEILTAVHILSGSGLATLMPCYPSIIVKAPDCSVFSQERIVATIIKKPKGQFSYTNELTFIWENKLTQQVIATYHDLPILSRPLSSWPRPSQDEHVPHSYFSSINPPDEQQLKLSEASGHSLPTFSALQVKSAAA